MLIERFAAVYNRIENAVARAIFHHTFPKLASDRLMLVRRLRTAMKIAVPFTAGVLVFGFVLWNAKMVGVAGLLFDIVGVCRIFLDDEWTDLLEPFKDENEYPFGPPSHVTRELMDDESPDILDAPGIAAGEAPEISRYYYWHRGMFLLLLGFVCQLIGLLMS